jgi:hypothetical protein
MTSQHTLIIQRLKKGWTSPLDALYAAGSMKLATRISELRRDGFEIEDRWKEENGKRFKEYKFVEVA